MTKIPLWSRDGHVVGHALVDDVDAERVLTKRWHRDARGYVRSADHQMLHRFIVGLASRDSVDHCNGDKLDNRRENLRVLTHAENMQNHPGWRRSSSRYRGVHFARASLAKPWRAGVWLGGRAGRMHYLGYFATELEAALAAARFRKKHMPYTVEPLLEEHGE